MKAITIPKPRVLTHGSPGAGNFVMTFVVPERAMGAPRQCRSDAWDPSDAVVRYRAWSDLLRLYCPAPPPAPEVECVTVVATFALPAGWSKRKKALSLGQRMRQKPDGDNVLKGVCDALWEKDQALGDQCVSRWWGEEDKTEVAIHFKAAPAPAPNPEDRR